MKLKIGLGINKYINCLKNGNGIVFDNMHQTVFS